MRRALALAVLLAAACAGCGGLLAISGGVALTATWSPGAGPLAIAGPADPGPPELPAMPTTFAPVGAPAAIAEDQRPTREIGLTPERKPGLRPERHP